MSSQDQLPPTVDSEPANPFAAPEAELQGAPMEGELQLATRGSRLSAAILDGLVPFLGAVVLCVPGFIVSSTANKDTGGVLLVIGAVVAVLLTIGLNVKYLLDNSQTIGKKIMKIKIVRTDGSHCGFWRIFLLRGLVMGLLQNIPFVGPIVGLVDPLLIFRNNYKCLHDDIADTLVVMA